MSIIYREEILEHFRDPQNFGKLNAFDVSAKQANPFCGDDIEVFVKFNHHPGRAWIVRSERGRRDFGVTRQGGIPRMTVETVSFIGTGCAICIASASLLTEYTKGKPIKELTDFSEEDMLSLLGVEVSETRKKCALLALATLRDCLRAAQNSKVKSQNHK